jgi:hypothetical protein
VTARRSILVSILIWVTLLSIVEGALPVQYQWPLADKLREFVLTAYPQLAGRDANVSLTLGSLPLDGGLPAIPEFSVRIVERKPGQFSPIMSPLLEAAIAFDSRGFARSLRADGLIVGSERLTLAVTDVNAHAEWSDQRVTATLVGRGATFVPDRLADPRAVFDSRVRQIEHFLGVVTLISARFVVRREQPSKGDRIADLKWYVTVSARQSDGIERRYVLWYEPFGGQLLYLLTLDP